MLTSLSVDKILLPIVSIIYDQIIGIKLYNQKHKYVAV